MIEGCFFQVYHSQIAQISAAISKTITLPKVYKGFEDIFSTDNASHLPISEEPDRGIVLIDGKQPPYRPIYSLSKNELSILQTYIDKNLANRFIRLSKSPAGAPIVCVPKPNKDIRLYVDYRGFNNLTIKNRYLFLLAGESLDRLGLAKQYTKLDLTDEYYWCVLSDTYQEKRRIEDSFPDPV